MLHLMVSESPLHLMSLKTKTTARLRLVEAKLIFITFYGPSSRDSSFPYPAFFFSSHFSKFNSTITVQKRRREQARERETKTVEPKPSQARAREKARRLTSPLFPLLCSAHPRMFNKDIGAAVPLGS